VKRSLIFSAVLLGAGLFAAEYFVSPVGSDKNNGTAQKPFRTINYGANKLKSGDVLTVLPGRYFEGVYVKKPLKNATIRAKMPGSVFLHGDKAAPAFKPLPGYRFIYVADWKDKVLAVNERDTLKIYNPAVNLSDLEYSFGSYFYKDGKLYISTSDGESPDKHDLTVSVLRSYGIHLEKPENVKIDGFVICGFYSKQISYWSGVAGIRLTSAKNCVVNRCKVFLCSSGINFAGNKILIENCISYANGSRYPTSAGNFIGWGGGRSGNYTMRNCVSMYRQKTGTSFGMRYYMGKLTDNRIENCVSYGEDGINVKGSDPVRCPVINSYSERAITSLESKNNVFGSSGATVNGYNPKDISPLRNIKKENWSRHYADPENHDFRPVSKVVIGLPKVIKANSTILLPPGNYGKLVISVDNVTVKTRGAGARAVLAGAVITGKHVHLDNLVFSGDVSVTGQGGKVISCEFKKNFSAKGKEMEVAHCKFVKDPGWKGFDGFRHSNIGTSKNLLDNGTSLDAFPLGPYRPVLEQKEAKIIGPFIHQITDSSVEIQWWTTRSDYSGELLWGDTPACKKRSGTLFAGGFWHAASLTKLNPGQKYYFKIDSRTPLREHHSSLELAVRNREAKRASVQTKVHSVTTLTKSEKPRFLLVKKSINETLQQARYGDTVLIPGGVYSETLRVPVSGITIRNVPGEKVWLDGKTTINNAVIFENKENVTIDGLFFRHYPGFAIVIRGGKNITVSRCFYDGRSSNYTSGMIYANCSEKLTMSNCFVTNGFNGSSFWRCKDLLIRNNVWFCNQISNFYLHNQPYEVATVRNNIFFDLVSMKIRNNPISTYNIESLREENNCYYFRIPAKDRLFCFYHRIEGDASPAAMTYEQFIETTGLKRTALFANPDMPVMPDIMKFKHSEFLRPGTMKMTDGYDKEVLEQSKKTESVELKRQKNGKFPEWDFAGWMSRNPECQRRNIGLEKELFTNGIPNGKTKAVGKPALSYYSQSVNDYYVDIYRKNFQEYLKKLNSLKTKADALGYQKEVREKILKAFGIPEKRTAPEFISSGVLKQKGYSIIKRVYEIRPGDFVAAHIYMPANLKKKAPAVLFLNGHTDSAKAGFSCRRICTTLVRNGCIVMTFDPSGQGERQLYREVADLNTRSVWQHNLIAKQMNLVGMSYAAWCAFDVIRMLDALFALPEVDVKRVGLTGNSGGGNMSAVVTALDERLAAAAPSCYLTTWKHNIENELPSCAEQEVPGLVGKNLEMADLLIAFAPRPHLVLGQKDDFFDPRGTLQTFKSAQKFYSLLGKKQQIEHLIGSYNHGYYIDTRHKMYNFFAKHLKFDFQYAEVAELPPLSRKELDCTDSGSVLTHMRARHPRQFAAEYAKKLAAERKKISVEKRKADLAKLLDIDKVTVPYFRNLRGILHFDSGKFITRFGLETEPGRIMSILYMPYTRLKTNQIRCEEEIELYIPHRDAVSEFVQFPVGKVERYTLDMRGVGALTPGGCQNYNWWGNPETHDYLPGSLNKTDAFNRSVFGNYNYDYHYWACGEMLGKPYLGGRVRDILGAMKLLAANGAKHIKLIAREQGVYPAVLAALYFRDCKVSVECNEMPPSFGEIMEQKIPAIPHSSLVTGILKYFDLPELLTIVNANK